MELKKLGRFEILEELGAGGMGVVYKGRDPKINRLVALKMIRSSSTSTKSSDQEQALQRFYVEAQSAGKLSHPNIVTIYDVGEEETPEGKVVYIAMEFLDGKGLDHHIEIDTFSTFQDKVKIIRQIAEGLHYAHKRDVVHRDVKPANIMVTEGNVPKLTDFGLARFSDSSLTMSGTILGTPNYMAPEQVQGKKVDSRSDFFALTVIFYEMLTGQKPFGGDTITTVIYRVVNEEPIPPSKLDPELPGIVDAMISKGLSKSREQRFQNGSEYIAALDALLAGAPREQDYGKTMIMPPDGTQEKTSPMPTASKLPALSPGLMAGIGAGVVAVIGLAVFLMTGSPEQPSEKPKPAQVAEAEKPPVPAPAREAAGKEAGEAPMPVKKEEVKKAEAPGPEEKKASDTAKKPEPKPKPEETKVAVAKPPKKKEEKKAAPKTETNEDAKALGYITVYSEPREAEAFLGDKFLGLTPINKLRFKQGEYVLKVTKSGYLPFVSTIKLESSGEFTASLIKGEAPADEAKAAPASAGALEIKAPPESVIYVDGREYREAELSLDSLSPGSHLVYIQMKGRAPFNKRVSIEAGKTEKIDIR